MMEMKPCVGCARPTYCVNERRQHECDACQTKRHIVKQTIGATKPVIPQPQPLRSDSGIRWKASKGEAVLFVVAVGVFLAGMFAGHFGVKPACEPAQQSRVYQA